jgi:hypothetical protein
MNANLFFLIFAFCLFSISVITITIAPIVSKAHTSFFDGWGTTNCQILEDDLDFKKSVGEFEEYRNVLTIEERIVDECRYHNTMYSLEYSAMIIDVSLGFIVAFLALINYIEPGNNFKPITGILGLATGVICLVITGVYLGYSSYIFDNQTVRTIQKLYSNKAAFKWNGQKYIPDYDETEALSDNDEKYIKVKDLGKKQYNYDSEIYQASKDTRSEYSGCQSGGTPNEVMNYNGKTCEYVWQGAQNDSVENKFLYDRWLTTIIFSALICVLGIGLGLFGFLVFNQEPGQIGSETPKAVPITSSANSVSRLKNAKFDEENKNN